MRYSSPDEAMAVPTASALTTSTQLLVAKPPSARRGEVTPPTTHSAAMSSATMPSGRVSSASKGSTATSVTRACQPRSDRPSGGGMGQAASRTIRPEQRTQRGAAESPALDRLVAAAGFDRRRPAGQLVQVRMVGQRRGRQQTHELARLVLVMGAAQDVDFAVDHFDRLEDQVAVQQDLHGQVWCASAAGERGQLAAGVGDSCRTESLGHAGQQEAAEDGRVAARGGAVVAAVEQDVWPAATGRPGRGECRGAGPGPARRARAAARHARA